MLVICSSDFMRGKTGTPFLREVIKEGSGVIQALNGPAADTALRSVKISYAPDSVGGSISMRDLKAKGGLSSTIKAIEAGSNVVRARVDGEMHLFLLEVA